MQISPRLKAWFDDYETYHRNPKNKLTHYVGVPMITVAVFGFLSQVNFDLANEDWSLALVLAIGASIWYIWLDLKAGLLFGIAVWVMFALGRELDLVVCSVLFVVGWIFQLVGHYKYEKNSPALTKNLL